MSLVPPGGQPVPRPEGMGPGRAGVEGTSRGHRRRRGAVRGLERGRQLAPRRVGPAAKRTRDPTAPVGGAGGAGPALYLPLAGRRKRGAY